ncbi:MAG: type II toxin-antitoxin system VapC family toxin [Symploca sp. SIO2G7]|nr:type II toxin-antitoxin system VapC family toxin [Symploca sp. SIO2G7]
MTKTIKNKNTNVFHKPQNYRAVFGQYTISIITVTEIVKGFHKVQRESAIRRFLDNISTILELLDSYGIGDRSFALVPR